MNFIIKFAKNFDKSFENYFKFFAINFQYFSNFCNKIFKIFLKFLILVKLFHFNHVVLNVFDL